MERQLKERLTGAGVLVLLAVIFLPLLLDDSQEAETKITTTNIPEKPDMEFGSKLIPMPEQGEILPIEASQEESAAPTDADDGGDATRTDTGQVTPEAATASSGADDEPQEDAATRVEAEPTTSETVAATAGDGGKPGEDVETDNKGLTGWVVQVGSFSRENADKLNDKLRTAGYRSYVIDEAVKGKDASLLYRVRVGPEILRSEALKLKEKLKKEMKLEGIVLNYP